MTYVYEIDTNSDEINVVRRKAYNYEPLLDVVVNSDGKIILSENVVNKLTSKKGTYSGRDNERKTTI